MRWGSLFGARSHQAIAGIGRRLLLWRLLLGRCLVAARQPAVRHSSLHFHARRSFWSASRQNLGWKRCANEREQPKKRPKHVRGQTSSSHRSYSNVLQGAEFPSCKSTARCSRPDDKFDGLKLRIGNKLEPMVRESSLCRHWSPAFEPGKVS